LEYFFEFLKQFSVLATPMRVKGDLETSPQIPQFFSLPIEIGGEEVDKQHPGVVTETATSTPIWMQTSRSLAVRVHREIRLLCFRTLTTPIPRPLHIRRLRQSTVVLDTGGGGRREAGALLTAVYRFRGHFCRGIRLCGYTLTQGIHTKGQMGLRI